MHGSVFLLLVAVVTVAHSEGEYYVPRAYYTIDETGQASPPVLLPRLRRSYNPGLWNAEARAVTHGKPGNGHRAFAGHGVWSVPAGGYGAADTTNFRRR